MPGWATFWWIIGLILFIISIISILSMNPVLIISLFLSSFAFFTIGRVLRCITNILENQKKILNAVAPHEQFVND